MHFYYFFEDFPIIIYSLFRRNTRPLAHNGKIGVSAPRVSDYLTGRSQPTFSIAKKIHHNLNIDANLILA